MDIQNLSVNELKEELKKRVLKSVGKKAELVERLEVSLKENKNVSVEAISQTVDVPVQENNSLSEDYKRKIRAEKFQTVYKPTKEQVLKQKEEERIKRMLRAERFGIENSDLESEKKRKRAEKFGTVASEIENIKESKRSEEKSQSAAASQFELSAEDQKKKELRAKRFAGV